MKKMQATDLFANIKNSIVSFFSILMFAALGIGVFLGISWAAPALEGAADSMFAEGSFHNFQIQYPYGLTEDNLDELSKIEGVSQVEAGHQSFQTLYRDGRKYTLKLQTIGEDIDVPILREGVLPTRSDEMAFHAESARLLGIGVGDTITLEKDSDKAEKDAEAGIEPENASGMQYLWKDTFTVTAIVDSADYIAKSPGTYGFSSSPSGAVDALAWVPDSAFDTSAFQSGYPIVNVHCESLDGKASFADEYKQASSDIQTPIEELGATLAAARYDELHGQAQKALDEGQVELDAAEKKIAETEDEIADGEKKLADGREELAQKRAEGQAKLDDAYSKLMKGENELAAAERELDAGYAKVNSAQSSIDEVDAGIAEAGDEVADATSYKAQCDKDLANGKITEKEYNKRLDKRGAQADARLQPIAKQYGMSIPSIDHTNYDSALYAAQMALANSESLPVEVDGEAITLGEARQRLASAKKELASAQTEYNAAAAELDDGWNQYYAGQATLESEVAKAEEEIADGEAKIADAKKQVEDGKEQIAEKKPVLEEYKAELEAMVKYDWTVLSRSLNAGSTEITTFSNVTNNLSISMAALFIIVGLLVSYFAVSRIVHEQVTQIGTKKALGFRKGEITASFLWYSGIAVAAGAIVGAIVAFFIVEAIIGGALGGMFAFGTYPAHFGWGLFLIITVLELALVLGATYLACHSILKEHAVELLRGDKPPTGKTRFYEKWKIWDKLPLLIQTIVNNCINDKRRVLSTIVGVAGCTALIVTAITLNNDVLKSYDRHYENVYGFNTITYVENEPKGAAEKLQSALDDEGCATACVFKKRYLMTLPDGTSGAMSIIVPGDEGEFDALYHVNPTEGGGLDLSAEGAWVSQAYAEHFHAKIGDTVSIDGGDGTKHEVPILGFYEFWLTYNEMVIGKGYFEEEFGEAPPNVVLAQTGNKPVEEVEQAISSTKGFDSMFDDATEQYSNFETFSTVSSAVVAIYLALAAVMAVVVLLNLNVMFIAEKKRELIVLMINGFSVKDARHYISYDSIVLTALGIIVGLVLGCIMGSVTVTSVEPVTASFVKSVDFWAVVIGIAGSIILAVIMSLIALRRVNNFELTDINRF